jgi:hypothetical protein
MQRQVSQVDAPVRSPCYRRRQPKGGSRQTYDVERVTHRSGDATTTRPTGYSPGAISTESANSQESRMSGGTTDFTPQVALGTLTAELPRPKVTGSTRDMSLQPRAETSWFCVCDEDRFDSGARPPTTLADAIA